MVTWVICTIDIQINKKSIEVNRYIRSCRKGLQYHIFHLYPFINNPESFLKSTPNTQPSKCSRTHQNFIFFETDVYVWPSPCCHVTSPICFEFLYVHDLWPRSRNNLELQYSQIFINIIRCLLPLLFRSLAALVSEKSTIFTFSYRKA